MLISAVISNAEAVGEWLNGEPNVVKGTTLIPTFRSVGFASWLDQWGRIEYVDSRDAEHGHLLVSALCEFIEMLDREGTCDLINRLQLFQKRLKYGLPTEPTIALYELGISDRVIAQDLATSLNLTATQKKELVKALKKDRGRAKEVMEKYPSYFQKRMNELLQ